MFNYASNMNNQKLSISGTAVEKKLTAANAYTLMLLSTVTGAHFLMTPESSTTDATINDFLLPINQVIEINVGRGLNRLTTKTEGATGSLYIGVLIP